MYQMSKTAALKAATKIVGPLYRHGKTQWAYYPPYRGNSGPTTEIVCRDFWVARASRQSAIVCTALDLMDVDMDYFSAYGAIDNLHPTERGSTRDVLDYVLSIAKGAA